MTWSTDWANGVSETITEIEAIASAQTTDEANIAALQTAVQPLATSSSSSLSALSNATVLNQFFKLFAIGQTNGGTSISITVNGNDVLDFPTAFSGGSDHPFIMEATVLWDGSNLYAVPVSPINSNVRMTVTSLGTLSTLTFAISGTSSVASFVLQPA